MMGVHAIPLTDENARRSAIGDHTISTLVEAGAGSGKTAILAGRVAMMLADGVEPGAIAAVTFTELAASELLARVRKFVAKLLDGEIPREMTCCLPMGLSPAQRTALAAAAEAIDDLACTTIHGFCQRLIKPYPAEADIDPGAKVAGKAEADLIFGEVKDAWLRERLSEAEGGLLAEMVAEDVEKAMAAVDAILDCLRRHPALTGPAFPPVHTLVDGYASAIGAFDAFVTKGRVREPESMRIAELFLAHLAALPAAPHDAPGTLVRLLRCLPDGELTTKTTGAFSAYQKKGKWEACGKLAGVSKIDAGLLNSQATDHYKTCCGTWDTLRAAIGACALNGLVDELRPAVAKFQEHKRAVGLLDFDDLIRAALKLLRERDDVRKALAMRYRRVLVDEFQDTDPQQAEIFWRLCGDPAAGTNPDDWRSYVIRPGALFVVGDPKQAVYRFRGADVAAYVQARAHFIAANATTSISTNFRSRAKVLNFVNEQFRTPLSDPAQPGFADLDPFHPDHDGHGVYGLDVDLEAAGGTDVGSRREAEAQAIADMCERLIGNAVVYDEDLKEMRHCRAGDIALLAPAGTDLWRYEAALEDRGIAVATQAGKGLFRQQEVQDLIALARTLADGRDTLALASLLRGPLVGLSEEKMLDIAWMAPRDAKYAKGVPPLNLSIELERIADTYARDIFRRLRVLRGLANTTTPHALLSQAVDQFRVRAMLRRRHPRQAERALANVDLFLEMTKPYGVRGLRAFAEAMGASWNAARTEGGKAVEGRVDVQEEAVSVYTMHAAKGLEWPIVVPINAMGPPMAIASEVVDRVGGRLFSPVFGVKPTGYEDAHGAEKAEVTRERIRLWYVTATRAKEMLVIPRHSVAVDKDAWSALVEMELHKLEPVMLAPAIAGAAGSLHAPMNGQDEAVWADEAACVARAHRALKWEKPSLSEGADAEPEPILSTNSEGEGLDDVVAPVQGGRGRGLIMHKLLEEALTGEMLDTVEALGLRAGELIRQLGKDPSDDAVRGLSAGEIAGCVARSLALPEIAALRPSLTPELPVYAIAEVDGVDVATAGVADAVSYDASGKADVVVDWKSDVDPDSKTVSHYRGQVLEYLKATGSTRGLIVFATSGRVVKVAAS